jgi:hypothetical protein
MKALLALVIGLMMLISAASAVDGEKLWSEPDLTTVPEVDNINLLDTEHDLMTVSYSIDLPAMPALRSAPQLPEVPGMVITLPELPSPLKLPSLLTIGTSFNRQLPFDQVPNDEPKEEPKEVAQDETVAQEAKEWLANELGVDVSLVKVIEFTQETWPDSCMGIDEPGVSCLMVITSGYRIIFNVLGEEYEIRTSMDGNVIRLAE